jgi:hypothetical protein
MIVSAKRYNSILKLVKNTCVIIPDMDGKSFCFKNGVFKGDTINFEGMTYEYSNILDSMIITRFNSGSSEYALVPIGYCGGGSGYFYYFLLFGVKGTSITELDCQYMTDSTGHGRFESMRIDGDTVLVEVDDYPHLTNKFLFRGNKLDRVKE